MKALVKISQHQIGNQVIDAVNARELHAYLKNGDHFATWIAERNNQYGFVEGQDYVTYSAVAEKGRPRLEYAISLDMAKELSMVERNEKGKEARQYFIACERVARSGHAADNRTLARSDTSAAYRVMTDMVVEVREEVGKTCKSHHFSNEALMLNEIIFGVRKPVDRDSLDLSDLAILTKMEMRNARLIGRGLPYAERKDLLKKYHEQLLLTPPPKTKMLKEKRA